MGAKSSVRFRRIGMELRKEREARGLTLIAAAVLLKRAPSSLSRIETGQTSVCVRDLEYIMQQYGLKEPLGAALLELAERGATREWWHRDASELTPELMDFISLE